jgi:hypothetical protein
MMMEGPGVKLFNIRGPLSTLPFGAQRVNMPRDWFADPAVETVPWLSHLILDCGFALC